MEVFNSTGDQGVAVIQMDDNETLNLKFQYRINISIIFSSNEAKLNLAPFDLNSLKCNNNVDRTNTVISSTRNVEPAFYSNAYLSTSTTSATATTTTITSDLPKEKTQDSASVLINNFTSKENTFQLVTSLSNKSDRDNALLGNSNHTKGTNSDEYSLVMENLSAIIVERENSKGDDQCSYANDCVSVDGDEGGEIISDDINSECNNAKKLSCVDFNSGGSLQSFSGIATDSHVLENIPDSLRKTESEDHTSLVKNFPCDICQKEFDSNEEFVDHQKALTVKIKCLVCKEECKSRADLILHDHLAHTYQGYSSKTLYNECPLCWEPFFNDSDLINHIKYKHTNEGVYKCCVCHKEIQKDCDYKSHTDNCRIHKNDMDPSRSKSNLVKKQHKESKMKSSSKFGSAVKRRVDIKENHRNLKKMKTDASKKERTKGSKYSSRKSECSVKREAVKSSVKIKKAKSNPQKKPPKQKRAVSNESEETHSEHKFNPAVIKEENHLGDSKDSLWDITWKCKFCERIFMNMREFNAHNMPTSTQRVCTKCGDRAKSKAEYLIHQCSKRDKEDSDIVSPGNRKCPVCEEEVLKKEILSHVMFQHTEEMPYVCCICGVPLKSHESWISHGESHVTAKHHDENISQKSKLVLNVSFTSAQNSNEIVCKLCKNHFYNEKDFIHHHKHEIVKRLCNVCEIPTYTEAGYIVHKYLSHGLRLEENSSLADTLAYASTNENIWEEDRFDQCSATDSESVKCPCCPDTVSTKDLLFHVMATHTQESPFKCCSCEYLSVNLDDYLEHCDFHLGKRMYNAKTPRCLQCDLRFESRRALNSHKQFHQKRCPYCQMEFSSSVFLRVHLQNYHTSEMEACSFCGKLFASSTQLAEHERHHYFSKESQCTVCGKMIRARNMSKHMKVTHPKSDEDCFFCGFCHKRFRDRHQMEQHQQCHSTDFSHECDVCKKKFKNSIRLREHAKVHLEKKRLYVCDVCGKTCTEKYNLQVHMRVHSSTKEFHCPICNQGFNYNQSLKSHMEKEHKKVPVGPQHFNCSFCNAPFSYIHTLEAHIREKHNYSQLATSSQWYP